MSFVVFIIIFLLGERDMWPQVVSTDLDFGNILLSFHIHWSALKRTLQRNHVAPMRGQDTGSFRV